MKDEFYRNVICSSLHDVLSEEYNFTEEELNVLDYITIPELKNHLELDCINMIQVKNGKVYDLVDKRKELKLARQIIKKLYHALYLIYKDDIEKQ